MMFDPFFKEYEALVKQVDAAFEKVQKEYGDCVSCKVGCADCCYALFDLTLVEAIYIKNKFDDQFADNNRKVIIENANTTDRKVHKLKRQAHKDYESGKSENEILEEMAGVKMRCPLLDADNKCALYDARPITCRLYGVPTVIGGQGHTCGLSGFKQGQAYPTVKLDAIHAKLHQISLALAQSIESRYPNLAEMLVPLSMALLTDYTEEYLGMKSPTDENQTEGKKGDG
jgi:Fe-S-cluster containining protein